MTQQKIPLAGVLGNPIAHSKSPLIHGHWLKRYQISGHYVPIDVEEQNLKQVLQALPRMGFVGVNVTLPHKEAVLEYADNITDRATMIGAANTLTFNKDGRIHADNTDGYGFVTNIRQSVPTWDPKKNAAAILGAGGAARAVVSALLDAGTPEIMISNRTHIRAERLAKSFGHRVRVFDWVKVGNMIDQAGLVINTTSLGMIGKAEMRVPLDALRSGMIVTDLVYNPLETKFLASARDAGCTVVDGLGMLLHQATPGFERWFGHKPEVDIELRKIALS